MRNRRELLALQKSLAVRQAEQLPLTPAITERATLLMEALARSHGLQVGDALIAAGRVLDVDMKIHNQLII